MRAHFDRLNLFGRDKRGGTAVEYGLVLALIFLAFIGALQTYGNSTGNMYDGIGEDMGAVHDGAAGVGGDEGGEGE